MTGTRHSESRIPNAEFAKIEADFRLWAFYEYYRGPFAEVLDNEQRFIRSLLASLAPIHDRQAVLQWHRIHGGGGKKRRRAPELIDRIADEAIARRKAARNERQRERSLAS